MQANLSAIQIDIEDNSRFAIFSYGKEIFNHDHTNTYNVPASKIFETLKKYGCISVKYEKHDGGSIVNSNVYFGNMYLYNGKMYKRLIQRNNKNKYPIYFSHMEKYYYVVFLPYENRITVRKVEDFGRIKKYISK